MATTTYSTSKGWGKVDSDPLSDMPESADIPEYLASKGWERFDGVGEEGFEATTVYHHAKEALYIVEFNTLGTWEWVLCDSFAAMIEVYTKFATIATARTLSTLIETMRPVELAAKDTDAWRAELSRQRDQRRLDRDQKKASEPHG